MSTVATRPQEEERLRPHLQGPRGPILLVAPPHHRCRDHPVPVRPRDRHGGGGLGPEAYNRVVRRLREPDRPVARARAGRRRPLPLVQRDEDPAGRLLPGPRQAHPAHRASSPPLFLASMVPITWIMGSARSSTCSWKLRWRPPPSARPAATPIRSAPARLPGRPRPPGRRVRALELALHADLRGSCCWCSPSATS